MSLERLEGLRQKRWQPTPRGVKRTISLRTHGTILICSKVWDDPEHHAAFRLRDNLMYTNNRSGEEVLCVPHVKVKGDMVITMIIAQVHQTLGHLGAQQTMDYIHRWYWWPKLGWEVNKYC